MSGNVRKPHEIFAGMLRPLSAPVEREADDDQKTTDEDREAEKDREFDEKCALGYL